MTSKIFLLISLVAAFSLFSAAQTREPVPVPIDKEPGHRLKLENEFVRVFDVLVPVGATTLFHTHVFDGVGVRVSDAQMADESIDGTKEEFTTRLGETSFGSSPEFSHRIMNRGKTDSRTIYIELLPSKRRPSRTTAMAPLTDAHIVEIDNERVRVSRLILKPGESSKPHTHKLSGLRVMLYDSRVETTTSDGTRRIIDVKAGHFVWQAAGTAHTIKNVGKTVFEAIDVEIK